jgi:anhydro-N-acetylmuramic acid kinase
MVYKVIGLMSGSSLDGLDIAFTMLEEIRGQWKFEIVHAACIEYTEEMVNSHADHLNVAEFLKLNTSYGRYIGEQVNQFIEKYNLHHQVHFIASHGHTVFHEPHNHTTCQIGDGASIAAVTGLPVISDLRALDVALGGQGAPIVPVGDKLLFGNYDYWLNIGGICNITVPHNGSTLAFDICAANQVLNILASEEGKQMDEGGEMASKGELLITVLEQLNGQEYYQKQPPKSLSNDMAKEIVFPILLQSEYKNSDRLRTMVQHIAEQIAAAVRKFPCGKEHGSMLITGGGAFNTFLIEKISEILAPLNTQVVVPEPEVVKYKEALVMALIGTLRWREETNVLSNVTGASRDSIGGALWMGHSYSGDE